MYEENGLVGKILNERYEILEVVGSGGMATVYKAECKLLNRYVAVKVLKDSLRYDLDLKEKFNKEAQAAAKLSHNNIVSIFDVGEIEGLNYIVMEFIDGITLKEYISQNKPINWMVARNIAIQIGLALEHAHANGIIHRDIKPHNILITKDNIIKVADFGIASAVSSETVVAGKNDAPMGSVHYISPEQARGGFVTETTDIYSLGVIMYEMVTAQLPFDGDNPVSIAMMKLEQEPVNCKVINLDIPHDMAEIIMRAIAKESAARFQTVQELLVALKRLGKQSGAAGALARDKEEVKETPEKEKKKKKEKPEKTEDGKKSNTNKIILTTVISMIVVILLVSLGVFGYINGWGFKVGEVKVPDLRNMTLEEAENIVKAEGFTIGKIEYIVKENTEKGTIISQEPGANIYVKDKDENKKISVVISKGETEEDAENDENYVDLESVVGMQYEDAAKKLKEMGLEAKKVESEDDNVPEGEVISQSPEAKMRIRKDSIVTLTVSVSSNKEERTLIPNVEGMTKENAKTVLENSGFKLGNVKEEESDKPKNEVLRQSPTAASESPKGTRVDIVVSAGKKNENSTNTNNPGTDTPSSGNGGEGSTGSQTNDDTQAQVKNITIPLPEDGNDTIHVRVVANGKEIYNKTHPKSDQKVDIAVKAKKDATIQVYFDGVLKAERVVEFN